MGGGGGRLSTLAMVILLLVESEVDCSGEQGREVRQ